MIRKNLGEGSANLSCHAQQGPARANPLRPHDAQVISDGLHLAAQCATRVDWLAMHSHLPFRLSQTLMKRPRREKGFPFSMPLSR